MKLGSLKQGRDGALIVVSRDLSRYVRAEDVAPTLQDALERWEEAGPDLQSLYRGLEENTIGGVEAFDPAQCASPLPRAYQVLDGSAYLNHVELVRKARGAEMPPEFRHDPLMYQAVSDTILGPCDDIPIGSESYGIDWEAEIAVVVDDVPMGVPADEAASHIKLIMLMNDVSLRGLIPAELKKGFGFLQSKPPSAFSPVAVTPDELEENWDDGKVNLPLVSTLNGKEVGHPNAGVEMQFDFPALIGHAAKTRPLGAGTIIGSGTVSNSERANGISCMAEQRMIEKIETGDFKTPFLSYGDRVEIMMRNAEGDNIFGTISQKIVPYNYERKPNSQRKAS